ncbi:MAG: DNA recombination protein RmuC [Phycisphaeraceae bacterium]|nr:DNA recombination protein RmuC [Phycisphaeraceae bacterium]
MDPMTIVFGGLAAVGLGGAAWLLVERGRVQARVASAETRAEKAEGDVALARGEVESRGKRIQELVERCEGMGVRIAALEGEAESAEQRHAAELRHAEQRAADQVRAVELREQQLKGEVAKLHEQMREAFRSLSVETLSRSTAEFLKLAEQKFVQHSQMGAAELEKKRTAIEQLLRPVSETLAKTELKLGELDKGRAATASALMEQMRSVSEANAALREETGKLVRALREPHVRGRYGEMQLKRVAELAGMAEYCDFTQQDQTVDSNGNPLKPDMVVRLPSDRVVVVDAKTNIKAYLEAVEATEPEEVEGHLDRFAKHVAEQATALSRKKYWAQYEGSPEFVVMFIPGDQFIDAALSRQPEILENAARQGVILASPSTLIGLLRAVHVGYKEQRIAAAAEELRRLGVEFHERAAVAFEHVAKLGDAIGRTVDLYNKFVGSYQSRLEPTLRKFEEEGAKSGGRLPAVGEVEARVRESLRLPGAET